MSDGSRLRQSWSAALNDAEAYFRKLLTSSSSEWKRIINVSDNSANKKGKTRVASIPDLSDVVVHRNLSKAGNEVYRLVLDVPTGDEYVSLEPWKAVLSTPELRQEWDPAVEEAHLLEMFDHTTRISKTKFSLGWPANPRDAVTISRLVHDPSTVIDITTSLPRSPDEPAYLRPSPPFVRSHVTLLAWCIQYIQPQSPSSAPGQPLKAKNAEGCRLKITCFWQHDLRALFSFASSGLTQQLSTMTLGLLKTVTKRASRISKLVGYGHGVSLERVRFEIGREALTVEYSIIPEDGEHTIPNEQVHGMDEVYALREQRRLTRSIECVLPSTEGWDVQITTKASSEEVEQLPWYASAIRSNSTPSSQHLSTPDQIVLRVTHAALADDHSVLKVKVVIEISGPSSGLRLNGLPQTIQDVEERDPSSYFIAKQLLQDISSTDLSLHTSSSMGTVHSTASAASIQPVVRPATERPAAAEKSILSRVRRNYIYFSSLLQEPEAKWRRTTDARGVSITQLDSIDPTLVVYRAEATFVGVGLWDLYGAIVSPGARSYWDKQHEDGMLLEDVNELTELWHYKTKPAWPVNGRDSILLKTVYKSPTTIHVFSFSADDPHLFPNLPPVEPNIIRAQVDLQGWAIEALSPTTTLLTLLEQSDPKGWANKTAIPTQMINSLAGIGEFVIKCGGPPVITRLAGAKMNGLRYDHERSSFRIEYEASANRRTSNTSSDEGGISFPVIECEIRCDLDTWAHSLDIVVDPPPQTISCLRRHRLSTEGGGLWISLAHDAVFVDDDRLLVIVRRAPGKEKGLVMVNGSKVAVDVEELPEQEIKLLAKQKRVKPPRIPLDQPPVMGIIRRRKAEWDADSEVSSLEVPVQTTTPGTWASAPQISNPLVRFFGYAVGQATATTQQAVAAMSPAAGGMAIPSPLKQPMQYALDALAWTQEIHATSASTGWELVSEKGLPIHKKLAPEISPAIPVHKGMKVIEGVSAEELASVIVDASCRKKWDDRYDSSHVLESYGGESRTAFVASKAGFPWRERGFYVASVMAQAYTPFSRRNTGSGEVAERSNGVRNAIFCVSASFCPDSVAMFSSAKCNPYSLPLGRIYVDAWILETLDPYTKENYAIPSTRCTRLVAVDYAGAIPAAVNSMINGTLPRSILAVESCIKGSSSLPTTRLPSPGLVIIDKKMDAHHLATTGWKLRKRDENRVLINTKYTAEDQVYVSTILVTLPPHMANKPPAPVSPTSVSVDQMTPRVGRRALSSSPPTEPSTEDLPQSSSAPSSFGDSSTQSRSRSTSPYNSSPLSALSSLPQPTASSTSTSALDGILETSLRGRASSSAFTLKGEVRPATDLLVAELVIDSKLYPIGYNIILRSSMRAKCKTKHAGREEYVPLNSTSLLSSTTESTDNALPFAYTIYTIPSSPLHSSGLSEGQSPTRHLLKLSLPTAQYQVSTVRDPLTGEMHEAPPRPNWLTEMQDGGVLVHIEVRPLNFDEGKGKQGSVRVDGKEVKVLGEKESLTSLGREELLDDRVSKMGVLSRIPTDTDPLPDEFRTPIAIADDLLEPVVADSTAADPSEQTKESDSVFEINEDVPRLQPGSQHDPSTHPSPIATSNVPHIASGRGPSGLFGFLQAYSNSLTKFTMPGMTATAVTDTAIGATAPTTSETDIPAASVASSPKARIASWKLPGGLGDIDAIGSSMYSPGVGEGARRLYPMSTVLVVALIAFLIGSLLRSLLSPADFIYVVTDLREAEEANIVGGWREIRRLLEIKYAVGGWDFQVAAVRRH